MYLIGFFVYFTEKNLFKIDKTGPTSKFFQLSTREVKVQNLTRNKYKIYSQELT